MAKRPEAPARAGARYIELRPGVTGKRPPATLDSMIAREHRRVIKLLGEAERLRRRIARARMRLSVLTRLAAQAAKRGGAP